MIDHFYEFFLKAPITRFYPMITKQLKEVTNSVNIGKEIIDLYDMKIGHSYIVNNALLEVEDTLSIFDDSKDKEVKDLKTDRNLNNGEKYYKINITILFEREKWPIDKDEYLPNYGILIE